MNSVVKSLTGYDNIVALGNMNDFWGSVLMEALIEGTELRNVLNLANVSEYERFYYVYNGNSQELDHMVAKCFTTVEAESVNMCSPYATQLSDHYPIVAKLTF